MTDTTSRALFDSACIRYRRCFKTGVRRPLSRQLTTPLADDLQVLHQFFLDLADKHIAHSVNGFEWWVSTAYVFCADDGTVTRGGLGGTGFSTLMTNLDQIARFQDLINAILDNITALTTELDTKLNKEVAAMSDAQLLALPDGSSNLESHPRVDRPRRQK